MKAVRLFVCLIVVLSLFVPICSLALEPTDSQSAEEEIVAVLVCNGVPYPLTAVQLSEVETASFDYENNSILPLHSTYSSVPLNQPGDLNTYYESSYKIDYFDSKAVYVTPAVQGPATISYGESYSITSTFSGSLSLPIKRKIVADLGASYSYSVSTNKNFTITYNVPAGTTLRIQFVPRMRHTIGTYYYDSFTEYDVDAYIPIKVNSFADGIYQPVNID